MLWLAGATPETVNHRFQHLFGRSRKAHAAAGVDVELIADAGRGLACCTQARWRAGSAQKGKVVCSGFGTGAPRAKTLDIEHDRPAETRDKPFPRQRFTLKPCRDQGVGRCLLLISPIGFRQARLIKGQGAMDDDIGVVGLGGLFVGPGDIMGQATERVGRGEGQAA